MKLLFRHLSAALVSLGIYTATPVWAVRLNPDGIGQALIFPYYTARSTPAGNSFVTLFTVTNVSTRPKALRVRFLEGKAGAEVCNFNLFLSAYDVWTAGVVRAAARAMAVYLEVGSHSPDDVTIYSATEGHGPAATSLRHHGRVALDASCDASHASLDVAL